MCLVVVEICPRPCRHEQPAEGQCVWWTTDPLGQSIRVDGRRAWVASGAPGAASAVRAVWSTRGRAGHGSWWRRGRRGAAGRPRGGPGGQATDGRASWAVDAAQPAVPATTAATAAAAATATATAIPADGWGWDGSAAADGVWRAEAACDDGRWWCAWGAPPGTPTTTTTSPTTTLPPATAAKPSAWDWDGDGRRSSSPRAPASQRDGYRYGPPAAPVCNHLSVKGAVGDEQAVELGEQYRPVADAAALVEAATDAGV